MADGGGGVALASGALENGRGGRFVGTGQLTEQQQAFVRAFVLNGGNGTAAAEEAGYASPRTQAYHLQELDHVRTAIRAERSKRLDRMTLVALGTIEAIMTDGDASKRDRLMAARLTFEAAGVVGKNSQKQGDDLLNKPLSEMTPDELGAFIAAGTAKLAAVREAAEHVIDVVPIEG